MIGKTQSIGAYDPRRLNSLEEQADRIKQAGQNSGPPPSPGPEEAHRLRTPSREGGDGGPPPGGFPQRQNGIETYRLVHDWKRKASLPVAGFPTEKDGDSGK